MIINKETILSLNKLLGFDCNGNEQDWPVEFSDRHRIFEFIEIINSTHLSDLEKYSIVSLVLSSYDDYLESEVDYNNNHWSEIVKILNANPALYDELLNYWAAWGKENKDDLFFITPLVRVYLKSRS